jgi:hypothetical protein
MSKNQIPAAILPLVPNPNNRKNRTSTYLSIKTNSLTKKHINTQTKKHINTQTNELNAENTTPAHRYPQNILDRMHPYTLYFFNSQISFNLQLEDIQCIVGPQSCAIFQFNGRNFFIFGENHRLEYKMNQLYIYHHEALPKKITIGFDGFIRSLISKYDKFNFELYYEKQAPWIVRKENNYNNNKKIKTKNIFSMISILDELFLNCSRMFNKSNCEYPNLRVHHADARLYGFEGHELDIIYTTELNPDQIKEWDAYITNYATEDQNFLALIEKQKKDINASTDIIMKINSHFNTKFRTASTTHLELMEKFAGILDYYTILRMLRNFDETKSTYGRTKHWNQQNIIGYFGDKHASYITHLLLQHGGQMVYQFNNPRADPVSVITKDCIDKINKLIQQS